jgi:hypothetical protein
VVFHDPLPERVKLLMQALRPTAARRKHWLHVARNCFAGACQLGLHRSMWHSKDLGCLKG